MRKFSFISVLAILIAVSVLSCNKDVPVTGVQLDKTSLVILVDKTAQLTATVSPSDATNKDVKWESSDPEVATVTSSGLVTAVSRGGTIITVTTDDGNKTASCFVEVKVDPSDPDLDPKEPNVFVSKQASKRNVLLEEFTGNECPNCPRGHKAVDKVLSDNPRRAFAINTHAGFMSKAYRTTEGTAIDNAFNNVGGYMSYPIAAISRMLIPYEGDNYYFVVGDDGYAQIAAEVLKMDAYVNVEAKSVIDKNSRELKVNVQAYFTASPSDAGTVNMINVALVQNSVMGPQSGASSYYPAMGTNSSYTHNHMLRKNITGTWGEEMPANASGTLYDKTFTYTIPAVIGDGADAVTAVLEDLEIIVYVTQKQVKSGKTYSYPVINVNKSSIVLK